MCPVLVALTALDLPTNSKIWIAYSGGLDSTVLLHASIQVFGSSRCRAIHINHQLNSISASWVEHCMRTTDHWQVDLTVDEVEVLTGNLEYQARLSRYSMFRQRVGSDDFLFTAHQLDDDIETLVWQFFTGRAMIGIPETRPLGSGTLCRPLLHVEKQELEAYAKQHELTWIEDESNKDTSFDRNWIRHELVPQLQKRFPQGKHRILDLKQATLPLVKREPLELPDQELTIEDIRAWLLAFEVNPPTSVLREIQLQVDAKADANPEIKVADGLFVRRYRKRLHVVKVYEEFTPLTIEVGRPIQLNNGNLTWKNSKLGFEEGRTLLCTNRLHLKEDQRSITGGGMHKKLANLFQESSIPPWLRDGWPVLCEGETVVSLVDIAMDTTSGSGREARTLVPIWHPFD
ncbi:MAG: tRNA lysidine(34) synthetase TilS [Gammaproteobacteria bacterium]|nr:tRNA lysidine(34) synthetase TilS [Gammaproteobacteria bacterium]